MKKTIFLAIILLSVITNLNAQTIFSSYSFNVEPKDESTVLQLYKDYFSNKANVINGVTVSLYQNHFDEKGNATHQVVFAGTPEAMGAAYDSKSTDAWKLFQSELSQITKGVNAVEGERIIGLGDTSNALYPIQDVYFITVKDESLFMSKFEAFWSKNTPKNVRVAFGSIDTKGENGVTHYVVRSYKNFSDKFKDNVSSIKGYAEYINSMKEIRTIHHSTTRILLGKW